MSPGTIYLNDTAAEPTIKRLNREAKPNDNGEVLPGMHSGLTTGKFVGKDSSGFVTEADRRAGSQIPALGALVNNARATGIIGTRTPTIDDNFVDYYDEDVVFEIVGLTLLINVPIWLSSGGDITQIEPTVIGDLKQYVGYPVSATEFCVKIGPPATVGI